MSPTDAATSSSVKHSSSNREISDLKKKKKSVDTNKKRKKIEKQMNVEVEVEEKEEDAVDVPQKKKKIADGLSNKDLLREEAAAAEEEENAENGRRDEDGWLDKDIIILLECFKECANHNGNLRDKQDFLSLVNGSTGNKYSAGTRVYDKLQRLKTEYRDYVEGKRRIKEVTPQSPDHSTV